jgi:hypothetical protein
MLLQRVSWVTDRSTGETKKPSVFNTDHGIFDGAAEGPSGTCVRVYGGRGPPGGGRGVGGIGSARIAVK